MIIDKADLDVVTSDKIYINHELSKIDEEGIFSQRIFGPIKPWKCACGVLNSKILHDGQRCEKCGVLCADPELRYTTFAKMRLPFPFFKNSKAYRPKLDSTVGKFKSILDPHQSDRNIYQDRFIELVQVRSNVLKPKITNVFIDDLCCIPVKVTGIYSLYLALYVGAYVYQNQHCKDLVNNCFSYELIVTPPKSRDIGIQLKKGKRILTSNEINEQYCRILKIANFDWPNIVDSEKIRDEFVKRIKDIVYHPENSDEFLDDIQVQQYDQMISRYQNHINNIYRLIVSSLGTKTGYIRKDFIGRSIDFSARAHIVSNPALKAYEISVSKQIFLRLWFIEYLYYLNIVLDNTDKYNELLPYVEFTDMYVDLDKLIHVDDFINWMLTENDKEYNLLVFINRQPTLWRYGAPVVKIVEVTDTDTIGMSNLTLAPLNADFDGDTVAMYRIHDVEAQKELMKKAYIKNEMMYDHNDSLIQQIRLEAIYPMYLLLSSEIDINDEVVEYNSLAELPNDFESMLHLHTPIKINDKINSYGVCLFNKWCDLKEIQVTHFTDASVASRLIYVDSNGVDEYNERMHRLSKRMFWFVSIHPEYALTISLDEFNNLDLEYPRGLMKKLPKNPYIGQHLYKYIQDEVYRRIPKSYKLKSLLKIKVNKTQLSRLLCGIGYIADSNNIVDSNPIHESIISGLDEDTFFQTVSGTRKGLTDKSQVTPESGYMERSMVVNLSPIELDKDDCGTKLGFNIEIKNKMHVRSLRNKYYIDPNGDIQLYDPINIENEVGKSYMFRSPMCCANEDFKICKVCFGKYDSIRSKYVGVVAGQSISERLTQLTMRTFHTSGSCDLPTDPEVINIINDKLKDIVNNKATNDSTLIFEPNLTNEEIDLFSLITGYNGHTHDDTQTKLTYMDKFGVVNRDVTATIKEVKKLTQSQGKNTMMPIAEVYERFIINALSVGQIYSSFIETVLCNMYVTKDGELLRIALQTDINAKSVKKLNIKTLHTIVSKLLGLLYEPNEQSICKFADVANQLPITKNTVLERFWNDL